MRFRLEELDAHHDVAIHEVSRADLDLIAEDCKARHNAGLTKTADGDWHVMRADPFTVQAWCDRNGITFAQFMRDQSLINRFIDDPDNAAFRIHKGRV